MTLAISQFSGLMFLVIDTDGALDDMPMQMRQPVGTGRGSGQGMRASTDRAKSFIGLRYPESFVQEMRLAAGSKNMKVGDYIREIIEDQVDSNVAALADRLNSELTV